MLGSYHQLATDLLNICSAISLQISSVKAPCTSSSIRVASKVLKAEKRSSKCSSGLVIPMELIPEAQQVTVPPVKSAFQVVPRGKSKSMFDIIGANGKRMNEQPLTKAVAERLKADLEK